MSDNSALIHPSVSPPAQSGGGITPPAAGRTPRYLRAGDVVREYGLSADTWRRMALRGEIVAVGVRGKGVGKQFVYDRLSIEAYMEANRIQPPPVIDQRQLDREWRASHGL